MIKVILPHKISLNKLYTSHWSKKHAMKKDYRIAVKEALGDKMKPLTGCVKMKYDYYLKGRLLDWDNCTAMTKILQDILVEEGIHQDDTSKFIRGGMQTVQKSKESYAYVEIKQI
jgi:hypothetical protein